MTGLIENVIMELAIRNRRLPWERDIMDRSPPTPKAGGLLFIWLIREWKKNLGIDL